jgi:tRNA(fMet)-specific endonuclease VapC
MVVLDSTILIDLLKGEPKAMEKIAELEKKKKPFHTTQINVFELVQGIYSYSNKIDQELVGVDALLQKIIVLDVTFIAAHTAGRLSGELKKKGKTIHPGDAMIAGTALANNITTIITANVKDFKPIPNLKVEGY